VFTSGYCFGALHLFGKSMENRISPQTLFCFFLLTLVVFSDRVKFGLFSVMLGSGIAGKTARLAIPFTLTLPFVAASLRGLAVQNSLMQPEYATAFACSSSAMLFFCLILLLSLRISGLEQNIRDLSLRDELTGLYNRRGFYVLATHALKVANRSGDPFSVLFLDVDNLKQINDTLGHEAGSELLQEFAAILGSTIRGTDVVGRVGGDEFVIAGNAPVAEIELVVKRIEDATYRVNARHNRSYLVSYSSGHVSSDPDLSQSLDDLLGQADKIMYQAKRDKRASRANHAVYSWNASDAAAR
jgi:diguanylate cyclase (GGDEF)-like protein